MASKIIQWGSRLRQRNNGGANQPMVINEEPLVEINREIARPLQPFPFISNSEYENQTRRQEVTFFCWQNTVWKTPMFF